MYYVTSFGSVLLELEPFFYQQLICSFGSNEVNDQIEYTKTILNTEVMKTKYVLFYLGDSGEAVIHDNVCCLCHLFSLSKRKYYASNIVGVRV